MAVRFHKAERSNQSDALLWAGVLLGPLGWILDEGLSYALAQHACSTGHVYVLHMITIVSLLISLIGTFVARYQWLALGKGDEERGSIHDRRWWMARLGVGSGIGFSVVIIALAVPKVMLSPCS